MLPWGLWIAVGYFFGAVPVGVLLARTRGVDLRAIGSGNIGATNVGRVLGRRWGIVCFVLDVLKGAGPVIAAGVGQGTLAAGWGIHGPAAWAWLAVAAATIVGHVFPVWLGFRGGKGVATAFGSLLGMWPLMTVPALASAATWGLLAGVSRYVSVASVGAALALPGFALIAAAVAGQPWGSRAPVLVVTGALAALVVVRHRDNLARLRAGTESKIGAPLGDGEDEAAP